MCSGREFQIRAAANGKARLPTVESLTGGSTSRLVPAERSAPRPGTSAVGVNGPCIGTVVRHQHGYLELNIIIDMV